MGFIGDRQRQAPWCERAAGVLGQAFCRIIVMVQVEIATARMIKRLKNGFRNATKGLMTYISHLEKIFQVYLNCHQPC